MTEKPKLAIIGTGIAGMSAAHFLYNTYDITVYEQNDYIGGHTNTVTLHEDGKEIHIDTGFMVFNNTTYPNLIKLFAQLNVPYKNTDMSFSVQHRPTGLEYCGSGINGLFAQRKNIFNVKYIKMLLQIKRFNEESIKILDDPKYANYSMADYVKEQGYGDDFLYKYLSPMSSALWSTPTDITLTFPAVTLVRFFKNHGFLGLNTQFQWLTPSNGSRVYRDKIVQPFIDNILLNNAAVKVSRMENGTVKVVSKDGSERVFDKVIIATHADQAIKMMEHPTNDEKRILSKFTYQKNIATLHTDVNVMPKTKGAWSAWNYVIDETTGSKLKPYTVYYMNKLQQVSDKMDYFVSINGEEKINPKEVIRTIEYEHPIFNVEAIKAQSELPVLNESGPVYYCGSYFKYGFHEDALTSSVNLCSQILGKSVWEHTQEDVNFPSVRPETL